VSDLIDQTHTTESLSVSGTNIFMLRGGKGSPVLYLHGDRGGATWFNTLERLSKNHEVFAPDHPGFGQSDYPDWFDNIHDIAYFYLDLLEQLDLHDVHIIGSGLGGWMAAEIAVRSTARIASITLVGSYGIRVKGVLGPDVFLLNRDQTIEHLFHDPELATQALEEPFGEDDMDSYSKDREAAARVGFAPRFLDPHLDKWLHRINVPTLVAWGRHDRILPVVYAEHWASKIPNAKVAIFENSGHLPFVEEADAFNDTVEAFIEGIAK
jgi:pimeloyl-ACP methyl ester carboxylesterase